MNYDEFKHSLLPLTDKELQYKKHPEISSDFYKNNNMQITPDGIYRFGSIAKSENIYHGMIGEHVSHHRHNITLCKQTRFSQVPLHTHDYVEVNFVFSGQCTAIINGEKIILEQGEICVLDSEVVHTILPTSETDIILNILMTKSYFNYSFITKISNNNVIAQFILGVINEQEQHNQYILFHTQKAPILHDLITDLFCEYLEPKICSDIAIDCHMQLIFVELTRFWQQQHEYEFRKVRKNYITEILQFIEDHYNSCTLKEISDHFGFHPNSLSRKIRKETGQTFEEIITQYRLQAASFQLTNSNLSINSIAEQCGYSNQKSFYKKFYEKFGCTPGQYRKSQQADV